MDRQEKETRSTDRVLDRQEAEEMSDIYDDVQHCIFCGTFRNWASTITIMDTNTRQPIAIVTVCPDDRKSHTIQEIYAKIMEYYRQKVKEILY